MPATKAKKTATKKSALFLVTNEYAGNSIADAKTTIVGLAASRKRAQKMHDEFQEASSELTNASDCRIKPIVVDVVYGI